MTHPQFDAREVFLCVEMESSTTFVIVEGHEVDIYDNAIRGLMNAKGKSEVGWVVASGADKATILNFYHETDADNFFAIVDRDFGAEIAALERVTFLNRYSIENFVFDDMVVRQTAARLYKKAGDEIAMDTTTLIDHYNESLFELFKLLRAYQLAPHQRTVRWSEAEILGRGCWKVNDEAVTALIRSIRHDMPEIQVGEVPGFDVVKYFPAKLLLRGIYQYLKNVVRPPKFSKVYNNETAFLHALFWNLEYSQDFMGNLRDVIDFLRARTETPMAA